MMRFFFLILLATALFGLPSPGQSDIYRYVDAKGTVHFTNTPTGSQYSFYRKENGTRTGSTLVAIGPKAYGDLIRRYSGQFNLEEALVSAVIKAESNFNPRALSSKGAMGIMQLIPETARLLAVRDPYDPEDNIRGGSRYLRMMLDEFSGNVDFALAAYNAGPGAVRRHGGIPPYQETRTYVQKVKEYLQQYRGQDRRI